MTTQSAFKPARGSNQKLTANTTSATAAIGKGNRTLRFLNAGANVIFVRAYNSTKEPAPTATNADTAIGPAASAGCVLVIEKSPDDDSIAYLAETGATVFHVSAGEGGM